MNGYVHGYTEKEASRLVDQATTLTELLHSDTAYPPGSLVLEAGCGVGAQTITLAAGSPQAEFISVDISQESLAQARQRVHSGRFSKRHVPACRHVQSPICSRPFRPRVCLFSFWSTSQNRQRR